MAARVCASGCGNDDGQDHAVHQAELISMLGKSETNVPIMKPMMMVTIRPSPASVGVKRPKMPYESRHEEGVPATARRPSCISHSRKLIWCRSRRPCAG